MANFIKFTPVKITKMYLDKICEDLQADNNNKLMQKIISEYYLLRYGEDERKRVRDRFIEDYFND
jgi:hypothetical protein